MAPKLSKQFLESGLAKGVKYGDINALTKNIPTSQITKNIPTSQITKNIPTSKITKNIPPIKPSKLNDFATKLNKQLDEVTTKADDLAKKGDDFAKKGDDLAKKGDDLAKKGDDLAKKGDDVLTQKEIENITDSTLKGGKKTLNQKGKEFLDNISKKYKNSKDFISKNKKLIAMTIGGIGLATLATIAGTNSEKINNTNYTITSIKKDDKNPAYSIITYTPADKFCISSTITITDSNSIDPVDGDDIPIYNIIQDGKIKINKTIKIEGSSGALRCKTNFSKQLSCTIGDIVEPVVDVALDITKDVGQNALDQLLDKSGLPTTKEIFDKIKEIFDKIKSYWWVVLLVSLIPIILSSIFFVLTQLT
jgi:hypothetical protein